jgi:hypothetical protein
MEGFWLLAFSYWLLAFSYQLSVRSFWYPQFVEDLQEFVMLSEAKHLLSAERGAG